MEAYPEQTKNELSPYLSPVGAWAFAVGTAIGWGSLVVTSNTYLLQAGPWGSVFGLLVGAVFMLVIGRNYHFLTNCFPDAGGAYTYAKVAFGHDYGFLTAWFLTLTYIAIFWANVTSLPLFSRFFLGGMFKVGFTYTVFGYDVYFGEVLLCIVAILLTALVVTHSRKAVMYVMIGCIALIIVCITACFVAAAVGHPGQFGTIEPGFLPDSNALSQIVLIACISPWAFIGFENISHFAEEFSFSHSKMFRILVAGVLTATVLYIFLLLMSTMAYPSQYGNWHEYISDLGNLSGIEALPPFYVAYHYLGDAGVFMLMATLLALVVTSLFGNTIALSRLVYALGKDSVLPKRFAKVNKYGIPANGVLLIAVVSLVIPFLGRTAIGWIVDVTTIGATLVYGLVSAAAAKVANARGSKIERVTGTIGVVVAIVVELYLLLPSLFMSQTLAAESYFLFAVWSILGFALFRILLNYDRERRFGRAIVVWVALLAIVMFISFVWMNQSLRASADNATDAIVEYYDEKDTTDVEDERFIEQQIVAMEQDSDKATIASIILLLLASGMLLSNFSYMSRRLLVSEEELDLTKDLVQYDAITGLPTMARFHETSLTGAEKIRQGGERPAAIALNLVGMKDFNAHHGRDGGDRLLRAFGDVLKGHFGEEGCSRFAEDHFYAYAPESQTARLIEDVFDDFKNVNNGNTLPIRAGVYVCAEEDDIVSVGFDRARTACDLDRKTWQSHVSWYVDGMEEEARLRLHVLDSVDEAIEKRWIRPYYQAVVSSETGNVCHQEALARWIDPEFGFLSPGQFIPMLEEAGLLHKADMHIVDCVLEDMAAKHEAGMPNVPVSVNISLRDLESVDIASEIASRVDAAGIPRALLQIEFTESAASDDPEVFKTAVNTLRDAGFEVWMDDFGSGYSSLNSLKNFDFDVVKLDMDFLRGESGKKTWDVIAGVVSITHSIGAKALAEGVEELQQAMQLRELGVDMLQGWFYSKPIPLDQVVERFNSGIIYEDPGIYKG